MKLEGIYAPVPTPFDRSGNVDHKNLEFNFRKWMNLPLDGIVVSGSNGECPLLSFRERVDLFGASAALAKGKIKVIAGVHCPSTRETAELAIEASRAGVDALLLLPPHYYKGQNSTESLEKFFFEIADSSPAPLVLYNMPSNTGVNLGASLVAKIATHGNIIGIKDSSADIVQIATICRDAPEGFGVFAGSGSYFLPFLAVGCSGGTMGVANLFAGPCRDIFASFKKGNLDRARRIQLSMIGINQAVTARFGVPGLKSAMDHAGLYDGPVKPPLLDADETTKREIAGIFDKFRQFYEEEYA